MPNMRLRHDFECMMPGEVSTSTAALATAMGIRSEHILDATDKESKEAELLGLEGITNSRAPKNMAELNETEQMIMYRKMVVNADGKKYQKVQAHIHKSDITRMDQWQGSEHSLELLLKTLLEAERAEARDKLLKQQVVISKVLKADWHMKKAVYNKYWDSMSDNIATHFVRSTLVENDTKASDGEIRVSQPVENHRLFRGPIDPRQMDTEEAIAAEEKEPAPFAWKTAHSAASSYVTESPLCKNSESPRW